jgi:hypothetical protein
LLVPMAFEPEELVLVCATAAVLSRAAAATVRIRRMIMFLFSQTTADLMCDRRAGSLS